MGTSLVMNCSRALQFKAERSEIIRLTCQVGRTNIKEDLIGDLRSLLQCQEKLVQVRTNSET